MPMLRRSCGHLPVRQARDVAAGDDDAPAGRRLLAEQQAQERRLARARRSDEEDELALLDVDGHVAERDDVALVDLGDVLEAQHAYSRERGARPGSRVPAGPPGLRGTAPPPPARDQAACRLLAVDPEARDRRTAAAAIGCAPRRTPASSRRIVKNAITPPDRRRAPRR